MKTYKAKIDFKTENDEIVFTKDNVYALIQILPQKLKTAMEKHNAPYAFISDKGSIHALDEKDFTECFEFYKMI